MPIFQGLVKTQSRRVEGWGKQHEIGLATTARLKKSGGGGELGGEPLLPNEEKLIDGLEECLSVLKTG
jgi:hypothetical protein